MKRLALAVLAVALTLGACSDGGGGAAGKSGGEELRTEMTPLTDRFPVLAQAGPASWASGTMGTSDVGPSTYWIDAVVTLPQAEADRLRALTDADATLPDLVPAVAKEAPEGPYRGGGTLPDEVLPDGYSGTVVIDADSPTLVFTTTFE